MTAEEFAEALRRLVSEAEDAGLGGGILVKIEGMAEAGPTESGGVRAGPSPTTLQFHCTRVCGL